MATFMLCRLSHYLFADPLNIAHLTCILIIIFILSFCVCEWRRVWRRLGSPTHLLLHNAVSTPFVKKKVVSLAGNAICAWNR